MAVLRDSAAARVQVDMVEEMAAAGSPAAAVGLEVAATEAAVGASKSRRASYCIWVCGAASSESMRRPMSWHARHNMNRRWRSIRPWCGTGPQSAAPASMPCTGMPALDGASCPVLLRRPRATAGASLPSHLGRDPFVVRCMQPRGDLRQITLYGGFKLVFVGSIISHIYHNKRRPRSTSVWAAIGPLPLFTSKAHLSIRLLSLTQGVQCMLQLYHTARVHYPAHSASAHSDATPIRTQ